MCSCSMRSEAKAQVNGSGPPLVCEQEDGASSCCACADSLLAVRQQRFVFATDSQRDYAVVSGRWLSIGALRTWVSFLVPALMQP